MQKSFRSTKNESRRFYQRSLLTLVILFLTTIAFPLLPLKAQLSSAASPKFSVKLAATNSITQTIYGNPGQVLKISIVAENLAQVGGLNIELVLPWDQVSILEMRQSNDVCQIWDKSPEYKDAAVEFICVQGETIKEKGNILELTLLLNNSLSQGDIGIRHYSYIDLQGQLFTGEAVTIASLRNPLFDSEQTSGELTKTTNSSKTIDPGFANLAVWVSIFLVAAILITIYLGYRLIRLANPYHNFQDRY